MSTDMLMAFGGNYFYSPVAGQASPGFDTLDRDTNFTWAAQQRLSRSPARQFTGVGDETISIEGTLYPHLFGGLKTLDNLRADGAKGQPMALVRFITIAPDLALGQPKQFSGQLIGEFVLTRVRQSDSVIGKEGLPLKVKFILELMNYGGDSSDAREFLFAGTTPDFQVGNAPRGDN